jgi:hypothetical protein
LAAKNTEKIKRENLNAYFDPIPSELAEEGRVPRVGVVAPTLG